MFEITIKETRVEKKLVGGNWAVIGKRLLTQKDLDGSYYEQNSRLQSKAESGEVVLFDEYAYTPQVEQQVEAEREVLKQTVNDLDLAAVIKAINKI